MAQCKSITKQGEQCKNNAILNSKYCPWHQDFSFIISIIITFIIAATIAFFQIAYQDKKPQLNSYCYLENDSDPTKLKCVIENTGRKEAKDVRVSFKTVLPAETEIFAESKVGPLIEKSKELVDPQLNPNKARSRTVFSVIVPRVVPNEPLEFTVLTDNPDNKRAGKQMSYLYKLIIPKLEKFKEWLESNYPKEASKYKLPQTINVIYKDGAFFVPGEITYEDKIQPVEFHSKEEKQAMIIHNTLYKKYENEVGHIFTRSKEYKIPTLIVEKTKGKGTYLKYLPYIQFAATYKIPIETVQKEKFLFIEHPVPNIYDFEED